MDPSGTDPSRCSYGLVIVKGMGSERIPKWWGRKRENKHCVNIATEGKIFFSLKRIFYSNYTGFKKKGFFGMHISCLLLHAFYFTSFFKNDEVFKLTSFNSTTSESD